VLTVYLSELPFIQKGFVNDILNKTLTGSMRYSNQVCSLLLASTGKGKPLFNQVVGWYFIHSEKLKYRYKSIVQLI